MIFVDTWAWLALAHKHDPYHVIAASQHRLLQRQKVRYVTTDYVLSESIDDGAAGVQLLAGEDFDPQADALRRGFHRLRHFPEADAVVGEQELRNVGNYQRRVIP